MRTVKYTGIILPDGHLSLPDAIRKSCGLKIDSPVQVTLTLAYNRKENIAEEVGFDTLRTQPKDFGELVAEGYQEVAKENLAFAKISFKAQKEVIDAE